MSEPIRLNLGSGSQPLPGYINVDRKSDGDVFPISLSDNPDYVGVRTVADGSVQEVRASHVLEHFSHRQTLEVVQHWASKLRPGGVLKIAVPDFDKIVHYYQSGADPRGEAYLFGGHVDADDHHGAIFNQDKLRSLLRMAGLTRIRHWTSEIQDCASLPVSLNLQGTKPTPEAIKLTGVSGVMSMPRLDFTDCAELASFSAFKLGIPIRKRQGVFWHETLTEAIEMSIAEDTPKYILTLDSDTTYTIDDVRDLYQLMEEHPDAAAIVPIQMGRDRDNILMTAKGADGKNRPELVRPELDADLMPIATGHFGLTLIRVSALQALPKPWFWGQPDANGRWGDGRVDADIWFWQQMERAKMRVYQANRIVLGHIQLVVTFPDKNLAPIHQYVNDWRKQGKPQDVWE